VLTVVFTNEALIHVVAAVAVIGLIGVRFERHAGSAHVLGVYLLAGLAGSLAFVATATATGVTDPSVGASAAFLGLVGARDGSHLRLPPPFPDGRRGPSSTDPEPLIRAWPSGRHSLCRPRAATPGPLGALVSGGS
jgi:hypothetical protein